MGVKFPCAIRLSVFNIKKITILSAAYFFCEKVMNNSEQYFLKTSRLGFRQWREDDLSNAIGLWGDYEVTRYFDARGKLSHDEVQERLAKEIFNDLPAEAGRLLWA